MQTGLFDYQSLKMQFVRLMYLLLLLTVSGGTSAQVFWSVTDGEGKQNWLLGTVHSEDPRLLEFPEALLDALKQADRLALELVPDSAMLQQLRQAMHYDNGGLDEVLEPELYRAVVEILERDYGMGEPAVRRTRPWAVAMTLSVPPPETGLFMDLALSFRASGLGLDVIALETVDEQLGFLTGMTEEQQVELVRTAVADYNDIPELFEKLISTYLDGDLERLEALSFEHMQGMSPELLDYFTDIGLVHRNQVMLRRARPHLESGGLIIAVGALHLAGEQGLVRLLEAEGYTLKGIY